MTDRQFQHFTTKYKAVCIFCIASSLLGILVCLRHFLGVTIPLPFLTLFTIVPVLGALRYKPRLNFPLLVFILFYGLTIAIHPYPAMALRIMRFVAFAIGMSFFSPLLESSRLTKFRICTGRTMFVMLSVMVFISFLIWICLLMTVGKQGLRNSVFFYWGYCGLFQHGMTLSPVSAVVAIISIYRLFRANSNNQRILMGLSGFAGVIMCVVAGSRSAVAGLIVSLALLAFFSRHEIYIHLKKPLGKIFLIAGVMAIVISLPVSLETINIKNSIAEAHGSLIFSREAKWGGRINEFQSSPICGIGYANEFQDEEDSNNSISKIEPGSSWLSLLSYGGVIGSGVFLWFFILLLRKMWHNRHTNNFPLICPLLCFLMINGTTEGWLMFAGGIMFPIFWLTIAAGWSSKFDINA